MLRFDQLANGRRVEIPLDHSFEILLSENPTTGYRWHLTDAASGTCVMVQDRFEAGGKLIGGGGLHKWLFRTAHPGTGLIELEKRRAFGNGPAEEHFRLQLTVAAK